VKPWAGPVLIGLAILMAFWLGKSSGQAAEATANWIANAGAELKAHRAYAARDDSLRNASQTAHNRARMLSARFDSLNRTLSSIHIAPTDTTALLVARQCSLVIQACRERGDSLESALGTSDARLTLMGTRLAQSDSLLKAGLLLKECKILWITCPGRVQTFEAGAVLGLFGGFLLSRH